MRRRRRQWSHDGERTVNERFSRFARLLRRRRASALRPPPPDWRLTIRKRIVTASCLLALWTVMIEARLVYLQIYARGDLLSRARKQSQGKRTLPAKRGDIVDRHGEILATSVEADSVWADPSEIDDKRAAVEQLCAALQDCTREERREFLKRLENGREFAPIRREATPEQAKRVEALAMKGF